MIRRRPRRNRFLNMGTAHMAGTDHPLEVLTGGRGVFRTSVLKGLGATSFSQSVQQAENWAAGIANEASAPIFDAFGNVLGYIASAAAPFVGTGNAVEVTDAVGVTVGTLYSNTNAAVNSVASSAASTTVAAYNAAGQQIGVVASTLWQTIEPWVLAAAGIAFAYLLLTDN